MPMTVRCPNCDETFQWDEEGGRIECPICEHRFDAPRRRLTLSGPPGGEPAALEAGVLAVLQRGGLLQALAYLMYLAGLFAVLVIMVRELDKGAGGRGPETVTRLLALALAVSLMASWVLSLVAGAFWAMAETRGVSRPLGVAELGLSLLVLSRSGEVLFALTGSPFGPGGPFDDMPMRAYGPALLLTIYMLDAVRMVVLAAYLAAAARDTGRASLRTPAVVLAIVTPVLLVGPIGLMLLVGLVVRAGEDLRLGFLLLMIAGTVAAALWGLITVLQLRGAWRRMGEPGRR